MYIAEKAIEKAKQIKLVILDVDGVLTDGGVYVNAEGEAFKPFHVRDGISLRLWQKNGGKLAIITGRKSPIIAYRAAELGIGELWMGDLDKRHAYAEIKQKFSLQDEEIAYIGDDLVDLPILLQVGLPIAVGDAIMEVKDVALFITEKAGGKGAVREAMEFIFKAQGKWEKIVESFIKPQEKITDLAQ